MIYQKEMLEASETAKALVEGMKNTASDFTTATHVEHAKAMFKVTLTPSHPHTLTPSHPHPLTLSHPHTLTQVSWTPFLAAFSVALRDGDDPEVVYLCLDGFRCAIRIACIFSLDVSPSHPHTLTPSQNLSPHTLTPSQNLSYIHYLAYSTLSCIHVHVLCSLHHSLSL